MEVTKVSKVNVVKSQSNVVQIIKGSIKNETGSLRETSKAIKIFNVKNWRKSENMPKNL